MTDIIKTLETYKKSIEDRGYKVYALMLKGSQNYNLDDESSDIDAIGIIIPKLHQMRSRFSKKFNFKEGEVTCHDIYEFNKIACKGNPSWIETLHTEYMVGSDLSMFSHLKVNPSSLKGMMLQKFVAFDRVYPSTEKDIEKFGYCPKQLSNIIRLYHLLERDVDIYRYDGEERQWMLDIKRGRVPSNKEEAFVMRDDYVERINGIYDQRVTDYMKQTVDLGLLDDIVMEYLINNYKEMRS